MQQSKLKSKPLQNSVFTINSNECGKGEGVRGEKGGACVVGGVHGRGACMTGGMHGGGMRGG